MSDAESTMNGISVSSAFSREVSEISPSEFGMLPAMPSKKSPSRRKTGKKSKELEPSDYQKWLAELVASTGMTHEQFADLSEALGRRIPPSSLRSTLKSIDTLSFKVIEYIALTCSRDPLAVMARGLDNPPEERVKGFEGSLIEVLWNLYRELDENDRAHVERFNLKPLIADLRERIIARRAE